MSRGLVPVSRASPGYPSPHKQPYRKPGETRTLAGSGAAQTSALARAFRSARVGLGASSGRVLAHAASRRSKTSAQIAWSFRLIALGHLEDQRGPQAVPVPGLLAARDGDGLDEPDAGSLKGEHH